MADEKTYEMFWDCEYCGQRKLLGVTHRHCANCGGPQNPGKRYFPPENEKVAVQDHQFVGADLLCPSCREAQSAAANCCTNCGGPLKEGKQAARVADQLMGASAVAAPAPAAAPPAPKKSHTWIFAVVGAVVVLIVGIFVVRACWTKEAALEVSGHSWVREIAIEQHEEVEENGACKSMPSGAKELKRTKPEPSCVTRKVDQGDGSYKEKRECTDAEEQCDYKVSRWTISRTVKEEGKGLDSEPKWPDVKLTKAGSCVGCEREGARSESFLVHFSDAKAKDELSCRFENAERWSSFKPKSRWRGNVRMVGGDLDCGSLQPVP
jgi:hypothetical protein